MARDIGGTLDHNDRRSDAVRDELIALAIRRIEDDGLSISSQAVLVNEISAEVGISERQFARIWSSTDAFLVELLCELARRARIDRADTETLLTTWQYLSARSSELRTPEGRRQVLVDLVRTVTEYNFNVVTAANKWRTYAALSTTINSWPDEAGRQQLLDAMQASQLAFVDTMESFYRNMLPLVGYRMKPVFKGDMQPFVIAAASVIEGLGIVRATVPALVESRFELMRGTEPEDWSLAAISFMGVLDAFFELDPDFEPEVAISRLSGGMDVSPGA